MAGPSTYTLDGCDEVLNKLTLLSASALVGPMQFGVIEVRGDMWYLTIPASDLASGTNAIRITVIDLAGNVTVRSFDVEVRDNLPAPPTVDPLTTNDPTPRLTGTVTVPEGMTFIVVVDGVTYTLGDGDLRHDAAAGTWSLEIPEPNALADGVYEVTARVTSTDGRSVADGTSNELTIDTVAPTIPTVDPGYFEVLRPTLRETAVLGDAYVLFVAIDGAIYPYGDAANIERATSAVGLGTFATYGELQSSGDLQHDATTNRWSLTLPRDLTDCVYDVVVIAVDFAGNAAYDQTTDEIEVFIPPPAVPTVDPLKTIDPAPTVTGTAVLRAGVDVLTVRIDGVTYTVREGEITLEPEGDRWSLTIPEANALAVGVYDVEATVVGTADKASTDATRDELAILVEVDSVLLEHDRDLMGRVFVDRDGNGVFNEGDEPFASATLTLADGTVVRTEADGRYLFPDVPLGTRIVALLPSTVPGLAPSNGFSHELIGYGPFVLDLPLEPSDVEADDSLVLDGSVTLRPSDGVESVEGAFRARLDTELLGARLDLVVGVSWTADDGFRSLLMPVDRATVATGLARLNGVDAVQRPVVSEDGVAFELAGEGFRVAYRYAALTAPALANRVPATSLQVEAAIAPNLTFEGYAGLVRSGTVTETFEVAGLRRITLSEVPTIGSLTLELQLMGSETTLEPGVEYVRDGTEIILTKPYVGFDEDGNGPVITATYVPLDAERDVTVVGAGVAATLGGVDVAVGVGYDDQFRAGLKIATLLPDGSAEAMLRLDEAGVTSASALIDLGPAFADARLEAVFGRNDEAALEGAIAGSVAWTGGGASLSVDLLDDQVTAASLDARNDLGDLTVRAGLGYDPDLGIGAELGLDAALSDAVKIALTQRFLDTDETRIGVAVDTDVIDAQTGIRYDWRDATWRLDVQAGADLGLVRLDFAHVQNLEDGEDTQTSLVASPNTTVDETRLSGSVRLENGAVGAEVAVERDFGPVTADASYDVTPAEGPGRLQFGLAAPIDLGQGFRADVFGAVVVADEGNELRGGAALRYDADGIGAELGIDGATRSGNEAGSDLNLTGSLRSTGTVFVATADVDLQVVPSLEGRFGGAFRADLLTGMDTEASGWRFAPSGVMGYVDGEVASGITTLTVGVGAQFDLRSRDAAQAPGLALRPSIALRATWNDPLRPLAIQPRLGIVQPFSILGMDGSIAAYGHFLTRPEVGTFHTSASTELRLSPVQGVSVLFGYDTGETLIAPREGCFRIGVEGGGLIRW